jgi:hypothetical protein
MPAHDTQSESFRMLGMLQGQMDSMLREFHGFRLEIAERHRDNHDAIEKLIGNLQRENDKASSATAERVSTLEQAISELKENHDTNAGEIAATRRLVILMIKAAPIALPLLAYLGGMFGGGHK